MLILKAEVLFHAAGGSIGDEHAAGSRANEGEGVGDAARAEDGISGLEGVEGVADLDAVLAFKDVPPLVFNMMTMEGWAPLGGVVVLHGEEVVAAVFGGDLEGGGAVREGSLDGVAIFFAGEGFGEE